ncbi:helix-turn-helix domain-containing protein [Ferdinandcohnia sp. Marseille-Q9671]
MLKKAIGRKIRRIRKEKQMSQEYLGGEVGISSTYLSRIERGVANPSLGLLEKIYKELGIYSNELYSKDAPVSSDKDIRSELTHTIADIYEKIPNKYHDEIIDLNKNFASILTKLESEK